MAAAGCELEARTEPDLRLFNLQVSETDSEQVAAHEIEPGGVMPYVVDTSCYAWSVTFEPTPGQVAFEEFLTMPGPATWGADDRTKVAADRASAKTTVTVDGSSGQASNAWCIAEGDPEGEHAFTISRDGRRIGRLNFRVLRQ